VGALWLATQHPLLFGSGPDRHAGADGLAADLVLFKFLRAIGRRLATWFKPSPALRIHFFEDLHVQQDSDCQPRRDRLPRCRHRPAHGGPSVAVYSDADASAKHVAACDEPCISAPARPGKVICAGSASWRPPRPSGAQAVHPGYGFLSENEAFAQACAEAGLVFIGPPPSAIKAMGLKAESKQLMEAAGVPLVPGYHGADQDPALLQAEADRIGYPVLIKASAGGGGKGMRAVEQSADFAAALASCKREATNSFGDDAVLIEKYVQRPRHIEIQVFGDTQGNYVYLFERDCSVQRRHQKVLEEAPAPGMTPPCAPRWAPRPWRLRARCSMWAPARSSSSSSSAPTAACSSSSWR
jgi:hypothetical protein